MRILASLAFSLVATCVQAASTPRQDALLASYFAVWDDNRNITPENVAKLYARRIVYYGHVMSQDDLLRDKLNFIRRWPNRHYAIAPGSAEKRCDANLNSCVLTAILVWTTRGEGIVRSGRSRIRLDLAREDGALKIVREGAVTLG